MIRKKKNIAFVHLIQMKWHKERLVWLICCPLFASGTPWPEITCPTWRSSSGNWTGNVSRQRTVSARHQTGFLYTPGMEFKGIQCIFLCPGLKGPLGASIYRIVCLSLCNSVLLTNKVQYLRFRWWYSNQTWTVSSSMYCSHFTDISCPWEWGRVKI